jgi:exopolysaccharide biosynthesis WecB/TagA/CpsF family protein
MTVLAIPETGGRVDWKNILGTEVAAVDWDAGMAMLGRLLREKRFTKIGFLNAHSANIASGDREFARTLGRFLVLPDGIGVDIAAKLLYGAPFPANLNGTDFIPALLKGMAEPLKVGLLGALPDHILKAADELRRLAPQHQFVIIRDGFFRAEEEPEILAEIARLRPDILLVAMGVPRQEKWIDRNITAEHCTLPIAVGALFDFLSGAMPRAPTWIRRMRLEWVFRLMLEPARLFNRYVIGNPLFLSRVLRQKMVRARSR